MRMSALSERYGVEIPIVAAVDAGVNYLDEPSEMVKKLMGKDKKMEISKALLDMNLGL